MAVVLNEDITFSGECCDQLVAGGLIHVDTDAPLAPVLLHEIRTVITLDHRQYARGVAPRSRFDLDHVGAKAGHKQRARWSG